MQLNCSIGKHGWPPRVSKDPGSASGSVLHEECVLPALSLGGSSVANFQQTFFDSFQTYQICI